MLVSVVVRSSNLQREHAAPGGSTCPGVAISGSITPSPNSLRVADSQSLAIRISASRLFAVENDLHGPRLICAPFDLLQLLFDLQLVD